MSVCAVCLRRDDHCACVPYEDAIAIALRDLEGRRAVLVTAIEVVKEQMALRDWRQSHVNRTGDA